MLFLIVCLILAGCSSIDNIPGSGIKVQKAAVFCGDAPEDTIRLNPMNEGESVITRFMVRNSSGRTLHIERIHSGCGCTTASWSREPLKDGEETEVVLIFNSGGQFGKQFKTIEILSEEGETCRIFLAADVKY